MVNVLSVSPSPCSIITDLFFQCLVCAIHYIMWRIEPLLKKYRADSLKLFQKGSFMFCLLRKFEVIFIASFLFSFLISNYNVSTASTNFMNKISYNNESAGLQIEEEKISYSLPKVKITKVEVILLFLVYSSIY